MAGQSANPRRGSHQDGAVRAALASIRRTPDWNHSARISRPHALLDGRRPGYYNGHRARAGPEGCTPEPGPAAGGVRASVQSYRWQTHCRGLYPPPMAGGGVWRVRSRVLAVRLGIRQRQVVLTSEAGEGENYHDEKNRMETNDLVDLR